MTNKNEILLEEVLIGYLKCNKKVKLVSLETKEIDNTVKLNVEFEVPDTYGSALINGLNNIFSTYMDTKK